MKEFFDRINAGSIQVRIVHNGEDPGNLGAEEAAKVALKAFRDGKKICFWLMAAPSAFAFYSRFIELVSLDPMLAQIVRESQFFQLDDYPISRGSKRFPVTFRYLLEDKFFNPIRVAAGDIGEVQLLELTGNIDADDLIIRNYHNKLLKLLEDPEVLVLQIKGIGMDGHWAFHGAETPLDAIPGIIRVSMGEANRHQQMIDCPKYFQRNKDIPAYAVTCTVELLMKADHIIDIVPQPEKEFAVLACYGNNTICPKVPSSVLKRHDAAVSFISEASARSLLEIKEARTGSPQAVLSSSSFSRLKSLWENDHSSVLYEENVRLMTSVLKELKFI